MFSHLSSHNITTVTQLTAVKFSFWCNYEQEVTHLSSQIGLGDLSKGSMRQVQQSYAPISYYLPFRCIWAGQLCVLRVSMSSCWAAGTETASCAHPSLTSTPSSRRTPWTWFKEQSGRNFRRKAKLKRGNVPCFYASLLQRGRFLNRCGGGAAQQRQIRAYNGLLAFYILYFLGWMGLRHRWFGLFPLQTPTPKAKTNSSFT